MYGERNYLLHLLEILKQKHTHCFVSKQRSNTVTLTLTLKPFEKIFKNNDRGNKFYQISKAKIKLNLFITYMGSGKSVRTLQKQLKFLERKKKNKKKKELHLLQLRFRCYFQLLENKINKYIFNNTRKQANTKQKTTQRQTNQSNWHHTKVTK